MIPEAQLETWSHQGQTGQFTATYEVISNVLWDPNSPYATRNFSVFLQGSYKNSTNVHGDSDVDIVICTSDVYHADIEALSPEDKQRYQSGWYRAGYQLPDFKTDVLSWLTKKYPNAVAEGRKAIYIKGSGTRREADVVVASEFRRYYTYPAHGNPTYDVGICFFLGDGTRIENFPKQHHEHCVSKNQSTPFFKRTVRTYKNLRNKMIADRDIRDGLAPSYFLEGLLYNVPVVEFGGSYTQNFNDTLDWLVKADRSQFTCANGMFYLTHPTSPVTWRAENCAAFLAAAVKKRDNWK